MSRALEGPLEQLERLRQGYASTLADRVGELKETCVRLQSRWNAEDREIAARLAHKLSGSGAAFGFGKMGAAARDLEEFLSLISGRNPSASNPVPAAAVRAQLVELADAVVEGAAHPDAPRVAEHQVADVSPMADWTERTAPVVCLVDDDPDALRQMALQIGFFGYRVVSSASILALDELVEAHQPAALVVDVGFPEGATAGPLKVAEFRQMRKGDLPVVFISAQTDFESRLAAARAGAAGYFGKPAAVGALVELLDQLCGRQTRDPYRILIVDDEEDVGRYHALSLGRSGFHSEVITDPSSLIPTLEEFRPDLILMDLHLPGCSGIELSAMIRQDFRFATVPIVFLSAETDVDRQFAALSRGADDFLVKPIPPREARFRDGESLRTRAASQRQDDARRPDGALEPHCCE